MASPWLIHTSASVGRPVGEQRGRCRSGSAAVRPYSPRPVRDTVAAELLGEQLGAVTDAEDGDPELVDGGVDGRAPAVA